MVGGGAAPGPTPRGNTAGSEARRGGGGGEKNCGMVSIVQESVSIVSEFYRF